MAYDGTAGMKSNSTDYEGHFGLVSVFIAL
jgi:hypothetical protein